MPGQTKVYELKPLKNAAGIVLVKLKFALNVKNVCIDLWSETQAHCYGLDCYRSSYLQIY